MIINTFTGKTRYPYAAFDTETRSLWDGVPIPQKDLDAITTAMDADGNPEQTTNDLRRHLSVECWAWIVYTPDGFAIAESFEEFCDVVVNAGIKHAWWYYSPFDFAVLDHAMLSRGWKQVDKINRARDVRVFSECSNDFGARYTMSVAIPYFDGSRPKSHLLHMYDLRNILTGGLDSLLSDYKVTDFDGNPIRKLTMDYQKATGTDSDIEYMKADAAGLWHLVRIAGKSIFETYGVQIDQGKPECLTASGLAKRSYITESFPNAQTYRQAQQAYHRERPMPFNVDQYFRERGLLGGGLVLVNPAIRGQKLTGINAERDDVNSEYPFYMRTMGKIWGTPCSYPTLKDALSMHPRSDVFIIELDEWYAGTRRGMIPAWRHPFKREIVSTVAHTRADPPICMFLDEWEALQQWYDTLRYHIKRVFVYLCAPDPAMTQFIDRLYKLKREAKAAGMKGVSNTAKLGMNGLGGKHSQNPILTLSTHELVDNVARRIETGEEINTESCMHVVQGARITMGGRVYLRQKAIEITGGNVSDRLFYGDTDSLHGEFMPHETDGEALGALKIENKTPITEALFLAPKAYYEKEACGTLEIRAKGVHLDDIYDAISGGMSPEDIYKPGVKIQTQTSLLVPGGRAIIKINKNISRRESNDTSFFELV